MLRNLCRGLACRGHARQGVASAAHSDLDEELHTHLYDRFLDAFAATGQAIAQAFLADVPREPAARELSPLTLPCVSLLSRVADCGHGGAYGDLLDLLAMSAPNLRWSQTYTAADFGEAFMRGYGWVELVGTRGHFESEVVAGGVLMLAPGITYPDHHHLAEELYLPLTGGTAWRKGDGPFMPRATGELIHHPSDVSHAMRTGDEALVALYLWRGGPLAQRSTIGTTGRKDGA